MPTMRCEVVAVGTELLLGQIVDTNSAWIGEQLALAGIDSHFQTKVGDNHARMVSVLRLALERSDAVIVCGGLGPTQDDITREAIAEVMGVSLELDEAAASRIEAMFSGRGRRMPMNNLRQAEVPVGATAIADPQPGTAPGLRLLGNRCQTRGIVLWPPLGASDRIRGSSRRMSMISMSEPALRMSSISMGSSTACGALLADERAVR